MAPKLSTEPVAAGAGVLALGAAVSAFAVHKGWINSSDSEYVLGILAAAIALVGGATRRKVMPLPTVQDEKNGVMQEAYDLGVAHGKKQTAALFPPPDADERVGD